MPGLIRLEQEMGWQPDYMLRVMAMMRPDEEVAAGFAKRLYVSNAEAGRLQDWSGSLPPHPETDRDELAKRLYRASHDGILDAMRLEVVHLRNREDEAGAEAMLSLIEFASSWQQPVFPLRGGDLQAAGMEPGPEMGKKLAELEELWIESGFVLTRSELLG